ncbi:hypothetical protein [uncultured Ilyobacter sp.]|uniref:hypothetical protein n=1 Tax=uncultured Ilyobacter sp. TaxID=544433 RepID=UPI0029F57777|nr:hypothetical protein [uncultured Ilyobacter sp.]
MKKILLFYIMMSSFLYGEYLSTNGKVSFFYDTEMQRLHSIKGDVFDSPSISQIEIGIMLEKDIYLLRDHVVDVNLIEGTNILAIKSRIEDVDVNTYVFPSSYDKKRIYLINEFLNPSEKKEIQILYRLIPYRDTGILAYLPYKDYYTYGKARFKSLNNGSGLYISNDEYLDVFKFREVKDKDVKYQEDKLFFVTKIVDKKKKSYDMVAFDFSSDEWPNKVILTAEALKEEYLSWGEWNWDFKKYPKDIEAQLSHLKMLITGGKIPALVYYGKSRENLSTNLDLATILSIYGKSEESRKILQSYKFRRKNTAEDVAVLLSLFKSWEFSEESFDNSKFLTKVYPVIMRTLNGINPDGKFDSESQEIRVYYDLIVLMEELIVNSIEIKNLPRNLLTEKLEKVKKYVEINFMTPDGIKDSPKSTEVNPKNIKFVELYPENPKKNFIGEEFEKYYDKRLGYLVLEGEPSMDLEYNLNFAQVLYNNSFEREGERLYSRIRELVVENKNYLAPKMYTREKNMAGIYGELIYLYLLTNYYRGIE